MVDYAGQIADKVTFIGYERMVLQKTYKLYARVTIEAFYAYRN
jgi:hypothetical protein